MSQYQGQSAWNELIAWHHIMTTSCHSSFDTCSGLGVSWDINSYQQIFKQHYKSELLITLCPMYIVHCTYFSLFLVLRLIIGVYVAIFTTDGCEIVVCLWLLTAAWHNMCWCGRPPRAVGSGPKQILLNKSTRSIAYYIPEIHINDLKGKTPVLMFVRYHCVIADSI